MGLTFAQKALARAAGLASVEIGQIVDARPDVILSHDNTAAIAKLFAGLGLQRVACPDRLAIVLDHAVPPPTAEHAANHAEIRRFVAEQGITHFFDAGRGICHQVISEEALVLPGQLILGADSHTTHHGWLGAFGAGIGRSEAAALWATGELWLRVPETIRVDFVGVLRPGVTAKDVSLWVLQMLGPEAGIYRALEFGGPGLRTLSIESRMVLPNLMAESGAKNAYLEPDEAVFAWLAQRLAENDESDRTRTSAENAEDPVRKPPSASIRVHPRPTPQIIQAGDRLAAHALYPDPDAAYLARYTVDLSQLEPAIAVPHNPANVVPLSQVAGTRVHQAFIGTCTNGRLEDLAAAAAALRGPDGRVRRVADGMRLVVIPASSQVLQEALAAGYVQTFLEAGAMLGVPGCGPCMGNHLGIPAAGETVISTANRNFRGRMGNPDSDIYLASPAVVAASAVAGQIAGPDGLEGGSWKLETGSWKREPGASQAEAPDTRSGIEASAGLEQRAQAAEASNPGERISESHREAARSANVRINQSANLAPLTFNLQPSTRTGRAWIYGDDVNTDVIFPGKYTYTVKAEADLARHALEDLDPGFAAAVQPGDIIVAGRNWGCGSSREQAVTSLRAAGVRVIIAASFARIYFRNTVNNGLLPIVCPEAVAAIEPGERVSVDLGRRVVTCAAGEFPFPSFSPSVSRILDAGGLLEMLRART